MTMMWGNYQWQQQLHCQEGKCKFLSIMLGLLNQDRLKIAALMSYKKYTDGIFEAPTHIYIWTRGVLEGAVEHLYHQLKPALFSRPILGGVVCTWAAQRYLWVSPQSSHWLFKSANQTIVLSCAHQLLFHGTESSANRTVFDLSAHSTRQRCRKVTYCPVFRGSMNISSNQPAWVSFRPLLPKAYAPYWGSLTAVQLTSIFLPKLPRYYMMSHLSHSHGGLRTFP